MVGHQCYRTGEARRYIDVGMLEDGRGRPSLHRHRRCYRTGEARRYIDIGDATGQERPVATST